MSQDIKRIRADFEKLGGIYPKEQSVKTEQAIIGGVTCYWLTPVKPHPKRIIVYLHGGIFALGSIRSHESMVSHLSKLLNISVLFIEYSLSPEYPFPKAI